MGSCNRINVTKRSGAVLILALAATCMFGCRRAERIQRYEAPKDDASMLAIKPPSPADDPAAQHPSTAGDRMLAAIVATEARVWFFKMVGASDSLGQQIDSFRQFIQSLAFVNAEADPQWELPSGWTAEPGSGMRFATLKAGADQVSVIGLPAPQNVEANINRWRGQLQLPPLNEDEVPERLPIGDYEAVLVDLVGKSDSSKTMSGAPFAGGTSQQENSSSSSRAPPATDPGFTYDVPDGWQPGQAGGMRKAAFLVQRDDMSADMTVITLPGDVGGVLNNVNRWRGQVGLEAINQDQLSDSLQVIKIDGLEAQMVDLVGQAESDPKSMLAVMVMRDGVTWFFKLLGPAKLVADEKVDFVAFVESVRFTE